jgi:chaperonin GroES
MAKQNQSPTFLAAGQRKANFVTGANVDDKVNINPGILSSEPREKFKAVKVDHTRKMKRLTPKGDQILVKRREPENISAGGILIAPVAVEKDKPAEGTVQAVGPQVKDIFVNDHIIFGLYAGTEYKWGTETLLFMAESEVIATVEE